MDSQQLRETVMKTLHSIAPEVNPGELAADQPLRDQVDLDSMDWLNFLIGLHDALKVDIPQGDYARLRTLDELMDYLLAKTA
jgi:acyl carrier protein